VQRSILIYVAFAKDQEDNFEIRFYNLQAIIVVGFKVNNERAVRFHSWAGQIVKD